MKKIALIVCLLLSSSIFADIRSFAAGPKTALWYADEGQYQQDVAFVVSCAKEKLVQALNQPHRQRLAVVFDIDETLISNINQLKKTLSSDRIYQKSLTADDIISKHPMALAPMKSLYDFAKQQHIAIFILTGRADFRRAATVDYLHRCGYDGWTQLVLRNKSEYYTPTITFKSLHRKLIEQSGYDIVLNIGDQYSDLKGGYADNIFKLPNPFYYL